MIKYLRTEDEIWDSIKIKGNTIEELKEVAYEEVNKRGWKEEHCWSEVRNEM